MEIFVCGLCVRIYIKYTVLNREHARIRALILVYQVYREFTHFTMFVYSLFDRML